MNLNIDKKNNLISVKLSGKCNFDNVKSLLIEVRDACLSNNIDRIIIHACEECTNGHFSTMDEFYIGESIPKIFNGHSVQLGVAGCCSYFNQFVETVAVNRGGSVKISENESEVYDWLDL